MRYIIFIFFCLINTYAFSQRVKIIDQKTGKIVKNVTVYNDALTISLSSDNNGFVDVSEFNENEKIIFSHISYALLKVNKSKLAKLKFIINLKHQSEQLDEVVLSVFKKEEKTNRIAEQIAVVSAKNIRKISPQTSADLLATIPGIKVQKSQSGGGSPVIRGMNLTVFYWWLMELE